MPEVINKITGQVVASFTYDEDGNRKAQNLASNDLDLEVRDSSVVDNLQNSMELDKTIAMQDNLNNVGENVDTADVSDFQPDIRNAAQRGEVMYPGEGRTGYNIPTLKKGGKVKKY